MSHNQNQEMSQNQIQEMSQIQIQEMSQIQIQGNPKNQIYQNNFNLQESKERFFEQKYHNKLKESTTSKI
jgi:hypothetical protein